MSSNEFESSVSFTELIIALVRGWWLILPVTLLCALLSIYIAFQMTVLYKAEVVLAPADSGAANMPGGLSQLGGLASLAGFNLGGSKDNKTTVALEVVRSRQFLGHFIEQHQLLVPLMAARAWNWESNTLALNDKMYDQSTDQWLRDVSPPFVAKPSVQEAVDEFRNRLTVTQLRETGMVTISFTHESPVYAQQWLMLLVQDLNEVVKTRDMEQARRSLNYLEEQLKNTMIEEIRRALFQLIEEQTKTLMLTQVSDEYVFQVIDPAVVPEKRDRPNRALIAVVGTLFGGFLSCFIVLLRHFGRKSAQPAAPLVSS